MTASRHPFQFEIEAELFEKKNERGETEAWIGGLCTTDHIDSEGERVLQDGLDFRPFLDHGYFNDNHGRDTGAAVGEPVKAELRTLKDGHKGWYVEGKLFDNSRAQGIRELASSLERSQTGRKLGFSVEGAILDRDPQNPTTVRRAVVREVAITRCPVNRHTSLQTLAKSLSAGTGPAPVGVPVTGEGGAAVLAPESLEGVSSGTKKKRKRKMKKSEAILLLMKAQPRLKREGAELIVNYALRHRAA